MLIKDNIEEDNIKEDKLRAVFKPHGKTTKNKVDKVNKTKLPKLSVKEVIKVGLFIVPIL